VCWWGQLKLLVGELEFLTECRERGETDGASVVYVGAASGEHIHILVRMFPEIAEWRLHDGAKSSFESEDKPPNVHVVKEFSDDDQARLFANEIAGRDGPVIFVSDIRTGTEEENVAADML